MAEVTPSVTPSHTPAGAGGSGVHWAGEGAGIGPAAAEEVGAGFVTPAAVIPGAGTGINPWEQPSGTSTSAQNYTVEGPRG